jgi:hypothetical protein
MGEEIKELIMRWFPMDEKFWLEVHAEMSLSGGVIINLTEVAPGQVSASVEGVVYQLTEKGRKQLEEKSL